MKRWGNLLARENRVRQVFSNLISNAVKPQRTAFRRSAMKCLLLYGTRVRREEFSFRGTWSETKRLRVPNRVSAKALGKILFRFSGKTGLRQRAKVAGIWALGKAPRGRTQ